MQISLNNFAALSAGAENADLLQGLQKIMGTADPADVLFRDLVKSDVLDDAHVVLFSAEGCIRISTGADRPREQPLWLDIGCVSKLVKSTTMQSVLKGQSNALKRRLVDIVDVGDGHDLSEVTLEHLLNHTHGIDEPQGIEVQRTGDGRIDVPAVMKLMGPEPLHPSGTMYSYSRVGPWLIAAVLEAMCGERFIDIVRQVLPAAFPADRNCEGLCPAVGGPVRVDAEKVLMEFVRATAFSTPLAMRQVKIGPALSVPYPGWHPQERAISAGWKTYSHGWYGHQAILTETPMVVRVAPSDGFGLLVSSRSVHPFKILNALFAEEFVGRITRCRVGDDAIWTGVSNARSQARPVVVLLENIECALHIQGALAGRSRSCRTAM